MSEEKKSAIGKIIDADIEEVSDILEGHSFGELTNIKKWFEMEYSRVTKIKDNLNEKIDNKEFVAIQETQAKDTVKELYKILQRIEDRATIIEKLKDGKGVDFQEVLDSE